MPHPSAAPSWPELIRDAVDEALSLLVPVDCAGCDVAGWTLCPACRATLAPAPRRHPIEGGMTVVSGIAFDGVAARAIRALKADGRTAIARPLAPALAAAIEQLASRDAALVAVPASAAALRRRGFRVVDLVARRAGVRLVPALRHTRRAADQRGLNVADRRANVAGSLRARGVAGRRVIVVDDVLTTGATLSEAARALRLGGAEVIGGAVIAATPRRMSGIDAVQGEFTADGQRGG